MNKDVIYIEPEDDITDILANIKGAKNKIVALVPPKKVGVLRSAVNFKLIAKTAARSEKTVVLITSDESLLKLAENVKMPTAKTLQSKPKLPANLEAEEFGDDNKAESGKKEIDAVDDDVVDDEPAAPAKSANIDDAKKSAPVATKKKAADIEIDDDDFDNEEDDRKPAKKKKSNKNIPNFNKVQKPIIIGAILFLLFFGFFFWASVIAPAAKIVVKVTTDSQNFSENVTFVTDESKAKPAEGIFYIEEKSIKKTVEAEFTATGEVDKGTKATGSITVKATSPVLVDFGYSATIDIPVGSAFSYNGMTYISTSAATINITHDNIKGLGNCDRIVDKKLRCNLSSDATTTIGVVASANGDKYNIAEQNSGWTSSVSGVIVDSSSAMTGGTSKKVKVVSQKDVETAESGLESDGESEAREELTGQFSNEYILIEKSFTASSGKLSSSPAINEEVKDGVKPKVIKEIKYTIYAVERSALNDFIKAKVEFGDDTQILYSTGIAEHQSEEEDKGRIESFKKEENGTSGILKTVLKVGPDVNEQMLAEKALGKKIGEVQSLIKSIKGVSEVKVEKSFFWVTSVPSDPNKVSYDITVE